MRIPLRATSFGELLEMLLADECFSDKSYWETKDLLESSFQPLSEVATTVSNDDRVLKARISRVFGRYSFTSNVATFVSFTS